MIRRENRLKKNKHFKYIYRHGETKQMDSISLCFAKTKYSPFKVGFSVSKKIGKSVVRNKVKRRMSGAFTEIIDHVDNKYNYIFVARESIVNMGFLEIKQNMIDLLKRAKLYVD